jgi:ABC-type Mn2+/Zn2+ transport system ATPase subunit
MTTGLELVNFGWHTLSEIHLHVSPGRCLGVMGPSGSGKTLFLRAIADLDGHQGQVFLDGMASSQMPGHQWRRRVGLLPAEAAWWYDHVGEHFNGRPLSELERLGFAPEVLTWQISRLSSGERQRLALLRLLLNEPRVLLLDEPTANLDKHNTQRAESLLDDYRKSNQPVMVWVSHDANQLRRWCDTFYMLDGNGFHAFSAGQLVPDKDNG